MNDIEIREEEARLLSAARETNYAYWAALLTVNGILVSIFSVAAVAGVANLAIALALVASASASAWLMVSNFKQAVKFYRTLGSLSVLLRSANENSADLDEHLKKELEAAPRYHDKLVQRESWAQRLLCLQLFLIVILIIWSKLVSVIITIWGSSP